MSGHNAMPEEPEYTRREEVALDQGVTTPYIVRGDEPERRKPLTRLPSHRSGRVRDFESDRDHPEMEALPESFTEEPKSSPEFTRGVVNTLYIQLHNNKIAKMRTNGATERDILLEERAFEKRMEKYRQQH